MTTKAGDAGADSARMTLVEHLSELRSRLIKVLLAVAVGVSIGFALYPSVLELIQQPLCDVIEPREGGIGTCDFITTDLVKAFSIRFRVAGYLGVAIALPVILWQVWRFVMPGLYPSERRLAVPFILSSLLLFVMGATLAFWTLPRALEFLIQLGGDLETLLEPAPYVQLVTYMMLAFGVGFMFPVLLVFLQLAGVLDTATLRRWRRYAVVVIVAVVAILTPSGDPWSLAALSVPMYLFYELSILIGWWRERRRRKAAAAA